MAGNMSNYLSNKLLDHVLRNEAYTSPTTVYAALYTVNPGNGDTGTEVSGGSYARQAITFGAAASREIANSVLIEFPEATGSWGTVTHVGIRDADGDPTDGNLLWWAELAVEKPISTGDQLRFKIGDLECLYQPTA